MSQSTETSSESLELDSSIDIRERPVTKFNPDCVRKRSNWSTMKNEFKMDNADFEPDFFLKDMPAFSPKLVALLDKIKSVDARDQQKYGKTFKHFVFSDIKSGGQGAKMLASAFISNGWNLGYTSELKNSDKINAGGKIKADWGPLQLLSQTDLLQTRKENFYLLSSVPVFDKPISVRMKKEILSTFNSRPGNIYGDLARIIIMDSGFKEGIDLFDIKYIHIFEPSMNSADQKQVIGRGTRTCGQKGLEFHPTRGWPLDVFIYDLEIPEKLRFSLLGSETAQELLMKAMNADVRIATFGYDIERLAVLGSVDYELNKKVHNFQVDLSDDNDDEIVLGGKGTLIEDSPIEERPEMFENGVKFGYESMKKYIEKNFNQYSWEDVKMENLCGDVPDDWKNFTWDTEEMPRKTQSNRPSQRKTRKSSRMSDLTMSSYISPIGSSSEMSSLKDSRLSSLKDSELSSVKGSQKRESELGSLKGSQKRESELSSVKGSQKRDSELGSLKGSQKRESELSSLKGSQQRESEISSLKGSQQKESENAYYTTRSPSEEEKDEDEDEESNMASIKEMVSKRGGATIMKYTPTQEFVSNYFSPFAPVKGMLLYHSVGTGKTCSAIAAASTNFEPFDYTILWVTRTTLKSDIWKNMFDQVCNKSIQDRIQAGEQIPDIQSERMRLLSKAWRIRPLSYKQFSNLVSKKNRYYDQLVKENGEADPLQKTLLIIDEAHKLYGGGDLSSIERPDMNALHKALMNSYAVSGMNSVRVLLMTATPITENPMELVKLLNLCKPIEQQIPDTFDLFASQYLNQDGLFTTNGQSLFLDNIAGYISYLNREKDARQFSQPRIQRVLVPIVSESQMKYVEDFDKFVSRSDNEDAALKIQEELEKTVKQMEDEIGVIYKDDFKSFYDICAEYTTVPKKNCNAIINKNTIALMREIKGFIKPIQDKIKRAKVELVNVKKGQQSKLALIKRKILQNPTLFAQYKASTYAAIRENCSKKTLSGSQFLQAVQQMPEVIEIENEIQASKEKIKLLENQLKTDIESSKQKIKQLKESLKNPNIPPVEKTAIEYSIRDSQKGLKETKKERTAEIKVEIQAEKKRIKTNETAKKRFFTTVRKTLKKKDKVKQKVEKDAKKNEKKLKQSVSSLSEIKSEEIRLMAERREELIKHDLRELQRDILKKEVDKLRKQREKQELITEKEYYKRVQKTLKEREKAEEKERKNLEKLREKEQKKQQKQNKTRKQRV